VSASVAAHQAVTRPLFAPQLSGRAAAEHTSRQQQQQQQML